MEHLLIHSGYAALALLGFLEACCVPIPSEVTFGFAGVLAGQGHLNIVAVIVVVSLLPTGLHLYQERRRSTSH